MERYHLDVRLVSRNEWLQVCAEEQFAWDWARSYLSQIGFNEVALFERFAAESLDTYAKSLREASS